MSQTGRLEPTRRPGQTGLPGHLGRLMQVVRVAGSHALAAWLGPKLARWPRLRVLLRQPELAPPERLRVALEELGGTFIKLGQMLALQPDVLPLPYCDALFKLLDKIEPFPYSEVRRIVVEETGRQPAEIFEWIDETPLATASIGQVHVASLAGRKVAVKVQRPAIEREFAGDLRLMKAAIRTIRGLRLRPLEFMLEPLTEFIEWTAEELDFRCEARYTETLRQLTRGSSAQRIPEVAMALTTRKVLVVELLDGPTLSAYLAARERGDEILLHRLAAQGFVPEVFARRIVDNFLGNAFHHGIYHADLHPANLLILPDNVVGYIDFGITGVLGPHARRHLVQMTRALTSGDVKALATEFLKVSVVGPESDVAGFHERLEQVAAPWYVEKGGRRVLAATITRVMTDMLHLSRHTDVLPQRDVIKYIRSSIAIDGLVQRFAPGFGVSAYTAEASDRFLRWAALSHRASFGEVVDRLRSSLRLVADGGSLAERLLAVLESGEAPARVELAAVPSTAAAEAARRRLLGLAAFVLGLTVLLGLSPRPLRPGFNLEAVQVALLALASWRLWATWRSFRPAATMKGA